MLQILSRGLLSSILFESVAGTKASLVTMFFLEMHQEEIASWIMTSTCRLLLVTDGLYQIFTGFGRRDVVEYLLQNGANVHARDDGGLISLHNACSFGHAEVVNLLLSHGADPNARDNWNYTPLHEAAIKGKIDVCIGNNLKLFSSKF